MSEPWPPSVTLERDGIRLEPLTLAHEPGIAAAAADGELWNIRVTSVPEPQETRGYIETALKQRAEGSRLAFAVIDTTADGGNGKVIGSTSYHDIVPAIQRVEIGWTWYAQSYQRSKVNTLCKLMLMQHAFETLGCAVVGWRASHMNFASQRAIERLGAKRDGVLRHHAPIRDGKVRDTVMYSMLAGEWPAAKAKLEARLDHRKLSPRSATPATVRLDPITSDNLLAVLRLNPGAIGERMVATNAISIAQASVSANAVPRAIVAGEADDARVVGFLMLYDPTLDPALATKDEAHADAVDLWRLMIDFQQQGKGYGAAALHEVRRYAVTRPGIKQVRLSYVPSEGNPAPFYRAQGFAETGEKDGIEVVMSKPLAKP
ncbi:MAG: GNAT family N-acetyltransferase [Burkholderiales bacterium]|nr:GNAT family N-acetyltransferase [Burkholderiales bacterium]